jgi:hypothetical protein
MAPFLDRTRAIVGTNPKTVSETVTGLLRGEGCARATVSYRQKPTQMPVSGELLFRPISLMIPPDSPSSYDSAMATWSFSSSCYYKGSAESRDLARIFGFLEQLWSKLRTS